MTVRPETLAPGTRLIHVGPQKTGSTTIQLALFAAREQLPRHGAYVPAVRHKRRRAAYALGLPDGQRRQVPIRVWQQLTTEVAEAGDLRVCVSNEDFARTDDPAVIGRIVRELGGDHPVHVVAVARRLDRLLPSQWQQRVKWRMTLPWEEWLHAVLDDPAHPESRNTWLGHDLASLSRRWSEHLEPGQLTWIVSDEGDRGQQARVFAQLLGLPEDLLRPVTGGANRSLGLAEVELVRALGRLWNQEGWSHESYTSVVNRGVVHTLMQAAPLEDGPAGAVLPDWAHARVQELSDRRVEDLRALPVEVVGDLEHLRVPDREPSGEVAPLDLSLPVDRVVTLLRDFLPPAAGQVGDPPL